jgi:hypothetical protein
VILVEWTGRRRVVLVNGDAHRPLTSSSYDAAGVRRRRAQYYGRFRDSRDPSRMLVYHASHLGGRNAYSPCMHRTDAQTVSFTAVEVANHRIDFLYQPGAPCEGHPVDRITLCCNFS